MARSNEQVHQLSIKSHETMMKLVCDTPLKIKFESLPFPDFWIYIRNEYMKLSQFAHDVLMLFGSTYPGEETFP